MLIFEINVLHKLQNERNGHPMNQFIPAYYYYYNSSIALNLKQYYFKRFIQCITYNIHVQ